MMKLIFLTILSLLFIGATFVPEKGKWIIDPSSQLFIYGSSNVNQFTCSMDCYNKTDTLEYDYDRKACLLVFKKNRMSLPLKSFDCGGPMITKDFLQTLKSDKYPNLEIRFISIEKSNDSENVSGIVNITLANVTRQYTINYKLKEGENKIHLTGNKKVCFSDFDLKAPQK